MNTKTLAVAVVTSAVTMLGLAIGVAADTGTDGSTIGPATISTTIPVGSYLGPCAVVTPPVPDPCESVNGMLRFPFLKEIVDVQYTAKWKKDNPGEWTRLQAHLATPQCGTGATGLPQDMKTHYGAALYLITQAIACLPVRVELPDGSKAVLDAAQEIVWPPASPALDPKRPDKTPPSAPGPIHLTP